MRVHRVIMAALYRCQHRYFRLYVPNRLLWRHLSILWVFLKSKNEHTNNSIFISISWIHMLFNILCAIWSGCVKYFFNQKCPICVIALIEACSSSPCSNGGSCIDVNVDTFVCLCRDGFFGATCYESKITLNTLINMSILLNIWTF